MPIPDRCWCVVCARIWSLHQRGLKPDPADVCLSQVVEDTEGADDVETPTPPPEGD